MTTDNLTAALAAVQAELPTIAKGETAVVPTKNGGKYTYSYADLADVSQVILPLLGKHGLAWITKPTFNEAGKFVLAYKLRHVSGDAETGEYPLTTGTPQEIGSAITYARRYALCAVTGVAPAADDDDGAAATHRAQRESFDDARPARPARDFELANARAAIQRANTPQQWEAIGRVIAQRVDEGVFTQEDADVLGREIVARADAVHPAGNRTAEQPDQPAEQQPMDADWPEPARPGGSDPA